MAAGAAEQRATQSGLHLLARGGAYLLHRFGPHTAYFVVPNLSRRRDAYHWIRHSQRGHMSGNGISARMHVCQVQPLQTCAHLFGDVQRFAIIVYAGLHVLWVYCDVHAAIKIKYKKAEGERQGKEGWARENKTGSREK